MASIRILVVEDFEPFRRFIRSTLQEETDLQIIDKVADGLEAVQKAEGLHPDLILLDIGLPLMVSGAASAQTVISITIDPPSMVTFLGSSETLTSPVSHLALECPRAALDGGAHRHSQGIHTFGDVCEQVASLC